MTNMKSDEIKIDLFLFMLDDKCLKRLLDSELKSNWILRLIC